MCRLFGLVVPTRLGRQLNRSLVAEAAAGEQDTAQLGVLAEKLYEVALRYWMQVQCWGLHATRRVEIGPGKSAFYHTSQEYHGRYHVVQ